MNTRLRRLAALAVSLVLCALVAAGCSGASGSAASLKKAANADLAAFSSGVKDGSLWEDAGLPEGLASAGVDAGAFYEALTERFSYEVVDATADGDAGSVVVEVTNVNLDKVLANLSSELSKWVSTSEAQKVYENAGEAGIESYAYGRLLEMLEADDAPVTTSEETLSYGYADGSWTPDMDAEALAGVLFAGADVAALRF